MSPVGNNPVAEPVSAVGLYYAAKRSWFSSLPPVQHLLVTGNIDQAACLKNIVSGVDVILIGWVTAQRFNVERLNADAEGSIVNYAHGFAHLLADLGRIRPPYDQLDVISGQ